MASVQWTFARRIGLGFTIAVLLSIAIGGVAVFGLRRAVASKDEVIQRDAQLLIQAERLRAWFEAKSSSARGYLVSREPRFLEKLQEAQRAIAGVHREIEQKVAAGAGHELLAAVERADAEYQQTLDQVIAQRSRDTDLSAVARAFEEQVVPKRERVDQTIGALIARGEQVLEEGRIASNRAASAAVSLVVLIAALAALFCTGVALLLSRWLGRQIGTAVSQVQSSSAELQSSANQQAAGSKQQATAMNEITTTISELLATSRQIAESSVRVAQIAEETAGAATSGEGTVERAQGSLGGIRRQVDLVVNHMLELGKKSQQIGSVLDIVSELAEQTNILAINATIEATGAGESGRRFSVVADEIRKLADRVTGSAKEIRALIDEVRTAVNTTVMATETMSKAVDAGSRQFGDVVGSLKQIAGMVVTTTQAAREIELSTKQQSSAVEQVNVAITDVAQASRETEASSSQTLQTASQLVSMSRDLMRLVEPQAIAHA